MILLILVGCHFWYLPHGFSFLILLGGQLDQSNYYHLINFQTRLQSPVVKLN